MKIAFGLDGLLADLSTAINNWQEKMGIEIINPYSFSDEAFWATIPAHKDLDVIWHLYVLDPAEVFILTERPKALELVTLSWLKRNFMPIERDHVIYKSIKRFDCKIHEIGIHVDTQFDHEEWYKYQNTRTILWSR